MRAGVEEAAAHGYLAAGFVAYEAAAAFGLAVRPPAGPLPLAWFGLFPEAHVRTLATIPDAWRSPLVPLPWQPSLDRDAYGRAVDQIRRHIADGDTYQLNYTFRLRAPFTGDARPLFAALADAQRGPWSAFIDTGTAAICSASPELFFHRDGSRLVTRPMKGTRPRGRWPGEDAAAAEALRTSEKDRAENVMIVDLMRNDLGRLARPGSVAVTALCQPERYPAQWQLTSTVEAEARPGTTLRDVFAALFPSGSVTGAPKVRSMEILAALEHEPRGVYCGAIGLVEPGGRAQFSVAIRTVVVDRQRGEAEFGVGSGIVWDSQAADEFEECRVKAGILTSPPGAWSLLESLRFEPGRGCTLLARHEARMQESAAYFDVPFDAGGFHAAISEACAGVTAPAKVRVLLDHAGRFTASAEILAELPVPLRLRLADEPVHSGNGWLFHKTTHRDAYAAAAPGTGTDTLLFRNERGEVTEAAHFNLVVERDGRRVTPALSSGLLPGTLRAELLETGVLTEAVLTPDDLRGASRLWLINSVRGWVDAMLA